MAARKPRYFDRVVRLRRARKQIEADLQASARRAFQRGWRRLVLSLRRLNKQDGEAWWNDWADEFEQELSASLGRGVRLLAEIDQEWYEQFGRNVSFDPEAIIANYRFGDKVKGIAADTQDWVDAKVREWYATDAGLDELTSELAREFGEYRATLIGIDQAGRLSALVTDEMMRAAGLDRWTWQTRLDEIVEDCSICSNLHGQTFTLRDPMPPEGSHIGCRCGAAPLVE